MKEKEDKIFIDAALSCTKKVIDRKFITKIILEDKTNKIRRYFKSYGILQLALLLQEIYYDRNQKQLVLHISQYGDLRQKAAQKRAGISPLNPAKQGISDQEVVDQLKKKVFKTIDLDYLDKIYKSYYTT